MSENLDSVMYKINSDLMGKGLLTTQDEFQKSVPLNRTTVSYQGNRLVDSDLRQSATNPFNLTTLPNEHVFNEMSSIRSELRNTKNQLQKEIQDSQRNNSCVYCYNQELSKFREDTVKVDNDILIQIEQILMKLKAMSGDIDYLKQNNSNAQLQNNQEIQNLKRNQEINAARITELINNFDVSTKVDNKLNCEVYPRLELVEKKVKELVNKTQEMEKQAGDICKSVNRLNENGKVINKNVQKVADQTNLNTTAIGDIYSKIRTKMTEEINANNDKQNNYFNANFVDNQRFVQEKQEVNRKIDDLHDENAKLMNKLSNFENTNTINFVNKENYQREKAETAKQLSNLQNENAKLFSKLSSYVNLDHVNDNYVNLKVYEKAKEETDKKLGTLQEENAKLAGQISSLAGLDQVRTSFVMLENYQKEKEETEKKLNDLKDENVKLVGQLSTLAKLDQVNDKFVNNEEFQKGKEEIQKKIDDLKNQNNTFTTSYIDNSKYNKEKEELEKKISDLKAENAQLSDEIKANKDQVQNVEKGMSDLDSKLNLQIMTLGKEANNDKDSNAKINQEVINQINMIDDGWKQFKKEQLVTNDQIYKSIKDAKTYFNEEMKKQQDFDMQNFTVSQNNFDVIVPYINEKIPTVLDDVEKVQKEVDELKVGYKNDIEEAKDELISQFREELSKVSTSVVKE